MQALEARNSEVERLNVELAETNRGVLALYSELDTQAEALRKASEYKSRFLADMTHELRTPVNAMISLATLLLHRMDGDLNTEQEKQVGLIYKSATGLSEIINDLLDLAKIEAGKIVVRVTDFSIADLLSALRGIFRPLFSTTHVTLQINEPADLIMMRSDEGRISQILRNLVSNALKFTERGEVRVSCEGLEDGWLTCSVSDTGVGIAPENLEMIFRDFTQIDGSVQRRVRGTGLGLPLSRKLARLLGGEISVNSELDKGSTFVCRLPLSCPIEVISETIVETEIHPATVMSEHFNGK